MRAKSPKKTRNRQKCTHMAGAELRKIRIEMGFEPRDMRAVLDHMSRRTYQDYEANRRGIPAKLAARIRELHKHDREWMAGLGERIEAAGKEVK